MRINDYKGVTLIELIIVIAIVGILAVALGFSYRGWMGKYKAESRTKEIYTELLNARARAMNRNRMHFVNFPSTTSYEFYEDTYSAAAGAAVIDGDGLLQTASDTRLPTFPKTLEYAVTIGTTGAIPFWFSFNNRGMINDQIGITGIDPVRTICIFTDYDGDASHLSDFDPDYDCIVVSATRIGSGKIVTQNTAGGTCVSTNCNLK